MVHQDEWRAVIRYTSEFWGGNPRKEERESNMIHNVVE